MWIYDALTIVCWLTLIMYLVIASISVKRNRNEKDSWQSSGFALSMTLLLIVIVATLAERSVLWQLFWINSIVPDNQALQALGIVITAFGIVIAIWARVHLGRNWSHEPAIKEGHSLVTSGPYRVVRHPIYAGILLAAIGSVLVGGSIWIFVFIILAIILFFRMRKEEKLLSDEFQKEYSDYKHRSYALVPFIL